MTIFSDGVPSSPRCRSCSQQALLEVARGDADRIERLDVLQRALDVADRPLGHRGDLLDRGHQIAVVVQVADDRPPDLLQLLVVGLHRELPEQVIGQRAGGRERVLDRRQLLDLGRRARLVAVVQVVAEEVLVVGVVPGVGLLGAASRLPASRPAAARPAAAPRSRLPRAAGSRPSPDSADPRARAWTSAAA